MIEAYFLVPVKSNAGEPFPEEKYETLETRLAKTFGGWTQAGYNEGGWADDQGKVVRDKTAKYIVALDSWTKAQTLIEIIKWIAEEFDQDCIYLVIAGTPELIWRQ